jgi:LmbE family N-acetylglucosaminyl deacetylase
VGTLTATSAEPLIQGGGTPEAQWSAWLGLPGPEGRAGNAPGGFKPLALETWLPAGRRLVVLAPHPDDELLACGGLLAMHAERGGEVLLMAASDGEASHGGLPPWTRERLAAQRRAESAQGLHALKLASHEVRRFALPDGALAGQLSTLTARLVGELQAEDLLVTTWQQDGHPDHEACGRAAATAAKKAGCALALAPVWMWHWASPGDARVPWPLLHTLALNPRAQALKRAALAAHHSQLEARPGGEAPVLGDQILLRAKWPVEHFFILDEAA